jgi:hypothetical protein
VTVGIEYEEVSEALNSNDCAGDGIVFRNRILDKNFQGFPCAATEIGKKLPIVQEVTAEDFRDTEDDMPVGDLLEDIYAQPLPEFDHPLLMAGRAEMAALAGECQEIFMAAVFTFHAGKPVVQIAALEIAIDHLLDIGPPESVLPREMLVIDPDKGFKIVLYAAVVIRRLRISWTIHGGRSG